MYGGRGGGRAGAGGFARRRELAPRQERARAASCARLLDGFLIKSDAAAGCRLSGSARVRRLGLPRVVRARVVRARVVRARVVRACQPIPFHSGQLVRSQSRGASPIIVSAGRGWGGGWLDAGWSRRRRKRRKGFICDQNLRRPLLQRAARRRVLSLVCLPPPRYIYRLLILIYLVRAPA